MDGTGAEELVVDLDGELCLGVLGGSLEESEGRLEVGVTSETCDAGLLLLDVLIDGSAATPTETGLCATDGFMVLEVAVGEGVDEGGIGTKTGADELGRVGGGVDGEVGTVLRGDAERVEFLYTVADLRRGDRLTLADGRQKKSERARETGN